MAHLKPPFWLTYTLTLTCIKTKNRILREFVMLSKKNAIPCCCAPHKLFFSVIIFGEHNLDNGTAMLGNALLLGTGRLCDPVQKRMPTLKSK